ncbi:MAG TPA: class I SAM-dependent methyltransferase, partial [Xanthomarina gelatinilytica]|nr:class I SAM-dependent methyltransferase [Xanthomarina gelatinilytica]
MNNPKDLQSHWNTAYNKEDQKLGWFEENPAQTMQLIESCKLETD